MISILHCDHQSSILNLLAVHFFLDNYIQFIILTHTLIMSDHYDHLRPIIPVDSIFLVEVLKMPQFWYSSNIEPNTNSPPKSSFPYTCLFSKCIHYSPKAGICQLCYSIFFFFTNLTNQIKCRVILKNITFLSYFLFHIATAIAKDLQGGYLHSKISNSYF